jgi:hypothetical protein
MCYELLCPTPSKSWKLGLVYPFGASIPPRVEIILHIGTCETLLVVGLLPHFVACDRSVSVFNAKTTRIKHILICITFHILENSTAIFCVCAGTNVAPMG